MNIFNRVTLQSLKRNKTRTVVTIIGIILSAAMICAVTTFASSFRNYAVEYAIYNNGDWHGAVNNTDFDTYKDISGDRQIKSAVYTQQLGYSRLEESKNEFKPYLYVLGVSDNSDNTIPIHITAGQYPQYTNHILIPEHLSDNGGVQYKIGDMITLELGERMLEGYSLGQNNPCYVEGAEGTQHNGESLEIKETRTYIVVGFYERLDYDFEEYSAPGYTAITVADYEDTGGYRYNVYFKMRNAEKVYEYLEEKGYEEVQRNTDLLMYQGISRYVGFGEMLVAVSAIVIALIMFGSISLIYNAFSISVSERTKQFGLLSSIGATKKQLRRMVFFEALAVSVVGIPIGILSGIAGIGVTLGAIGSKFKAFGMPIDMKLCVSGTSVVVAALIALVTVMISAWIPSKRATRVTAVEAIRQNNDITANGRQVKTSRLVYRLFGLSGMLASKHYKRNKRKYRTTVLSLFMSIVLFVSASAFCDYLMDSASGGFSTYGYDLVYNSNQEDFTDITPQTLLEQFRGCNSVTDCAMVQRINFEGITKTEYVTKAFFENYEEQYLTRVDVSGEETAISTTVIFVDDEQFKKVLKKHNLKEETYMNPEAPLAVAIDGNLIFDYEEERYETVNALKTNHVEITVKNAVNIQGYEFFNQYETAEGKMFFQFRNKEYPQDVMDVPEEEFYAEYTLKSGKTIYEKPFYADDYQIGVIMLYPQSVKQNVFTKTDLAEYNYRYFFTSSNHKISEKALENVLAENGFSDKNYTNYAEMAEEDRNVVIIIQVFSYGFIILISLIAAANVFNTISTNISLRRREFAMLKSVGMTAKGFNKMMNYECLLYGSRALLFGLPVSVGVTYLIHRAFSSGYFTDFHLPWGAIFIAVLSVFTVVFVTMMYSMSKINRDNPIDALKNENL